MVAIAGQVRAESEKNGAQRLRIVVFPRFVMTVQRLGASSTNTQ
jgi:hypothetical protein